MSELWAQDVGREMPGSGGEYEAGAGVRGGAFGKKSLLKSFTPPRESR